MIQSYKKSGAKIQSLLPRALFQPLYSSRLALVILGMMHLYLNGLISTYDSATIKYEQYVVMDWGVPDSSYICTELVT